jgi:hypothetical protein
MQQDPPRTPNDGLDFKAWQAPDPDASFRAGVWQRIEARRQAEAATWWARLLASRVAYAFAMTAVVALCVTVWTAAPASSRTGDLFAAAPADSLTTAFTRLAQGSRP